MRPADPPLFFFPQTFRALGLWRACTASSSVQVVNTSEMNYLVLGTTRPSSRCGEMIARPAKTAPGKSVVGWVIPAAFIQFDGTSLPDHATLFICAGPRTTPIICCAAHSHLLGCLLPHVKGEARGEGSGFIVLAATLSSVGYACRWRV